MPLRSRLLGKIYLVDLTPSLLEMARERFARLGWTNVHLICADASRFRINVYVLQKQNGKAPYAINKRSSPTEGTMHADLITFSHSLSLISEFYPVIDMVTSLLSPNWCSLYSGLYDQNNADVATRNYTAGFHKRHIGALKRMVWRACFNLNRINLNSSK